MASTTSKKAHLFKLSLLAALLGAAGCASIPQAVTPESAAGAAAAKPVTVAKKSSSAAATAGQTAADDQGDQLLDTHLHADLWGRVRAGYAMPMLDSPLVARHEKWFVNNPEYLDSMVGRARLYLYYIVEEV